MKKTVTDLRKFRFSRLNEPEFSHLKLLGGWIVYFLLYFLTENLIPAEKCTPVHIGLDDMIPFCEIFAVPYVLWYLLVAGSLMYFALYSPKGFRKLSCFIMITQAVAMTLYILFPTRQDLRPDVFPRENFLTGVMAFIYSFDTSTGVCPSLHVAYSLGISSVFLKEKDVPRWWKITVVLLTILISASTTLVKQHSAEDVIAALPLGILAEMILYGKSYWLPKLKKRPVPENR